MQRTSKPGLQTIMTRKCCYFCYCITVLCLICVVNVAAVPSRSNQTREALPRVLFISFDGFSVQYLESHNLPNFQQFISEGVFAKSRSVFPSLTFPNHYSMVTGMTAEHHGITANVMYDKFLNSWFNPSCCDADNRWWHQNPMILPIFHANQQASPSRRSGSSGFVGSLSPVCGMKLFRTLEYDSQRPFKEIVDTMINWFTDPNTPLNFMAIYFYEPDKTGHSYGATSFETCKVLIECDDLLGYIKQQMQSRGIWDDTDIVITTDHGMMDVDPSRSAVLERYVDLSTCNVTNSLAVASIFTPNVQTTLDIYKNLSQVIPYCQVYYRETVPPEYYYSENIRVGDVLVVADPGYLIYTTEQDFATSTIRGTHGYNNTIPEMIGFLTARGPSINVNQPITPVTINIVDIYPLLEGLLGLPHHPVDGSFDNVKNFLKNV